MQQLQKVRTSRRSSFCGLHSSSTSPPTSATTMKHLHAQAAAQPRRTRAAETAPRKDSSSINKFGMFAWCTRWRAGESLAQCRWRLIGRDSGPAYRTSSAITVYKGLGRVRVQLAARLGPVGGGADGVQSGAGASASRANVERRVRGRTRRRMAAARCCMPHSRRERRQAIGAHVLGSYTATQHTRCCTSVRAGPTL